MPPNSLTISTGVPKDRKRIHLQDLKRLDACDAGVGVFVEQGFEDCAGFGFVFSEDVALLHICQPVRAALAAGGRRRRGRRGQRRSKSLPDLVGEFIEEDTLVAEFFEDGLLAFGVVPRSQEGIERSVALVNSLARVVGQGFGDKPAVFVEILDALASRR